MRAALCKKDTDMIEKEFDELCAAVCSGGLLETEVSSVINNLFYERFGMSYLEVAECISKGGRQNGC